MQDFCLFFYLLLIFVIFCKNNRSNGSEIRHKKCFFALFLFFVHLRQILSTFVSCSGRQAGASSFIVPDVIRLFSSFSDGYYPPLFLHFPCFLFHFPCFLFHFPCFLLHFPSFFLQNSCKFSLFPCTFHFFVLLLHPHSFPSLPDGHPTVARQSPDGRPTIERRWGVCQSTVNRRSSTLLLYYKYTSTMRHKKSYNN